jgi:hypothetical protein
LPQPLTDNSLLLVLQLNTLQSKFGAGADEDDFFRDGDSDETLCYQFAGLARDAYGRLSMSLGAGFDQSSTVTEMRVNNWVSPVLARLQVRCVSFF